MLKRTLREIQKNRPLRRYCTICGLTYILGFGCWLMHWRTASMQTALCAMAQVRDDVVRLSEFYWVGQRSGSIAFVCAGAFLVVSIILDERMFGRRPSAQIRNEPKSKWGVLGGFLFFLVTSGKYGGLFGRMYIMPVLAFLFALAVFALRLRPRMEREEAG